LPGSTASATASWSCSVIRESRRRNHSRLQRFERVATSDRCFANALPLRVRELNQSSGIERHDGDRQACRIHHLPRPASKPQDSTRRSAACSPPCCTRFRCHFTRMAPDRVDNEVRWAQVGREVFGPKELVLNATRFEPGMQRHGRESPKRHPCPSPRPYRG
jgi:hypothetical protein